MGAAAWARAATKSACTPSAAGTVAGEHSVLFLGEDEVLEIRHSAASRRIFARGALTAARFAAGKAPGLYSMQDVLWGGKDA